MTDKELLELAAKEAGGFVYVENMGWIEQDEHGNRGAWWNPFGDDGDALRLAVKLGINKGFGFAIADASAIAATSGGVAQEENIEADTDPYAATRRAIVRAAAEIGKSL